MRAVDVLGRELRKRSRDGPAEAEMVGGVEMDRPQTDGNSGVF